MKDDRTVSRRAFLQRVSLLGVTSLGAGALMTGCGGGAEQGEATTADVTACDDLTGLTEAEIQMRETLQYVSESERPDQQCNNCQLWIAPAAGAYCGGCQIIKGPIDPQGWCTSWAPQQAQT